MKKRLTVAIALLLIVLMLPLAPHAGTGDAETDANDAQNTTAPKPVQSYNLGAEYYDSYGKVVNSYLCTDGEGRLVRVEYTDEMIFAETYSDTFELLSSVVIEPELPLFGGFFAGKDRYYLIEGQENPDESNETEVVRVIAYTKDWERISHASLYGANTVEPFDAGSLRCAEADGYLYIRTCHFMYASGGVNHQANLTLVINEADMTVADSVYSVSGTYETYVSHSFNQFVLTDDNGDLIMMDHGDAYPRSAVLFKVPHAADGSGIDWYGNEHIDVIRFPGQIGSNYTGCALGGLEKSDTGYLAVGNLNAMCREADVPESWDSCKIRNAFVCYADRSLSEEPVIRYLTDFDSGTEESPLTTGESASVPQIVKFGDDRFLILWNVGTVKYYWFMPGLQIEYVFVNGKGEPLGPVKRIDGAMSDCKPIVVDGKAYWYVTEGAPTFFTMDSKGKVTRSWSARPELTGTLTEDGLPSLKWDMIDGAERYEVYAADSADGTYRLLESVTDNTYVHSAAKKQKTYFYKVVAVNRLSVKSRDSVIFPIAVPKKLSVTTQPTDRTVRDGEKAKFTAKTSGSGLSYQWYYLKPGAAEWKPVSGTAGRKATCSFTASIAKDGWQYRCRIKDASEAVYTDPASLTVKPIEIVITAQPENTATEIGKTVRLKVKAENLTGGKLSYQWYYRTSSKGKWKKASGSSATKATYWFMATDKKNGYQYRCKIKSTSDSVYSDAVTLKTGTAPTIETQPKDKSVKAKTKVKLTVKATGKELTYQWYYRTSSKGKWKKVTAKSGTKATYSFTATAKKNGYQYRCKVTNPFGSVYTKTVKLKVK